MFIEIGAKRIKAKATHFFNNNKAPIQTSRIPTKGNIYPVAPNEFIKSAAPPVGMGNGIKCKNLLLPKTTSKTPKDILTSKVNCEFIKFNLMVS